MNKDKKDNAGFGKRSAALMMGLFLVTLLAAGVASFWVCVKEEVIIVEAGDTLQVQPEQLFQTTSLALSFLTLEEMPDTSKVGEGVLRYSYLYFWDFVIPVQVVDTTPPSLSLKAAEAGYEPGTTLMVKDLVEEVWDVADEEVTLCFSTGDNICYLPTYGTYTETIQAVDDSGNKSEAAMILYVADAPVLETPAVYYVEAGKEAEAADFLETVTVTDAQDGEAIQEALQIELETWEFSAETNMEAVIWAKNSYHVRSQVTVPVHVVEPERLTEVLMADTDALFNGAILTEDVGREAEILLKPDLEACREELEATAVSIYYQLENGGYAYGNGFVIDLTEDGVYIASNYHVLYAFASQATITFYNGDSTAEYELVGGNAEDDVAFLKISRSSLSEETFAYLKEPEISLARVRTITPGEALFRDSIYVNKAERFETGSFTEYAHEIFNGSVYTTFSVYVQQGDSGSAIYDAHGYLISMCAGVDYENGKTLMCGVRLERIIADYEQYTGNSLYAY